MSSQVRKVLICDRCGITELETVADRRPPGWLALTPWGGGHERDLCHCCARDFAEFVRRGPGPPAAARSRLAEEEEK